MTHWWLLLVSPQNRVWEAFNPTLHSGCLNTILSSYLNGLSDWLRRHYIRLLGSDIKINTHNAQLIDNRHNTQLLITTPKTTRPHKDQHSDQQLGAVLHSSTEQCHLSSIYCHWSNKIHFQRHFLFMAARSHSLICIDQPNLRFHGRDTFCEIGLHPCKTQPSVKWREICDFL